MSAAPHRPPLRMRPSTSSKRFWGVRVGGEAISRRAEFWGLLLRAKMVTQILKNPSRTAGKCSQVAYDHTCQLALNWKTAAVLQPATCADHKTTVRLTPPPHHKQIHADTDTDTKGHLTCASASLKPYSAGSTASVRTRPSRSSAVTVPLEARTTYSGDSSVRMMPLSPAVWAVCDVRCVSWGGWVRGSRRVERLKQAHLQPLAV